MKMADTMSMVVGVREEQGNTVQSNVQEERIFVAIRVRPLNDRERARHDVSDWECISHNSIKFKNNGLAEQRSLSMDTYTFDRVFGEMCSTQQVYEQGIKEVSLSVVSGINSSIFAYGQTSSGKTYTMTGITEYAIRDIYEYIEKHREREFVVKFSAMEIYNEAVRDLLNVNATSLRLLDDPEKGTVVEKLTEETLTKRSQLQQLLSICAAERMTEETAMNETSSRSHQILRLTVESNPSDYARTARSGALIASVNFVDLAGSERASQTLSAGTRLREGSHINRSLLTLGTVIRKLSKERNGHIPYRDSKLTRILHNSLGGNARTAIICTISPSRSQVEQSKNTLFFAGCAKQVTTNAQVNVVKSDKVLVKQLQKELARMENELRSFSTIILKERELQIEQMDKEIKELTRQRDHFQSHVENLLQSVGKDPLLKVDKDVASESSGVGNNLRRGTDSKSENFDRTTSSLSISNEHLLQQQPENSEDNFLLDDCSPTFVGPDPCQGWEEMASRAESEDNCKEVTCIEIKEAETDNKTDVNTSIPAFEERGGNEPMVQTVEVDAKSSSGNELSDQDALQQETQELQSTNKLLGLGDLSERSNGSSESGSHSLAAISPPQIDEADHETSSHPQFSELEQNVSPSRFKEVPCIEIKEVETDHKTDVNTPTPAFEERGGNSPMIQVVDVDAKSSLGNGHGDQDTLQQETEVDLPEKSNGSSESELHILAATSPEIGKVDQETSLPPQSSKLEEDVSPSRFNKREQEPASPHQFDEQELKTMSPPQLDELEQVSFTLPAGFEREYSSGFVYFQDELSEPKLLSKKGKSSRKHSPIHEMDASVEDLESVLDSDTEDTASVLNFVVRMNERAKPKKPLKKDLDDLMVHARTSGINNRVNRVKGVSFHGLSGALMPSKFERQQREIIKLWDTCNVPLVHRSYFFLLIKGEISDSVYLDVELRRLSFLEDSFSSGAPSPEEESLDVTPNSSLMSLNRERKMLSKQVHKKFSRKEREELYRKWRIDLKTKHRSIQLAWLLWTNTKDLNHVRESAALVAKLVGFINTGESPKRTTFGLGFLARRKSSKSHNWKDTMSTLL